MLQVKNASAKKKNNNSDILARGNEIKKDNYEKYFIQGKCFDTGIYFN